MGTWGGDVWWNGRLDEIRISSVARTDGWIQTSFNNQDDSSAFYGLSGEDPSGNQTPDDPTIDDHNNGSTTSDNTPTLGFTQSDVDASEQVKYRIQIDATDNTFSNLAVDYTSALMAEGAAGFTVGQAAGSGTYTVGSESQTLPDGDYFWRAMTTDDDSAASGWTQATTGSSIAFTVDTSSGGSEDDYTQDADIVSWWYLDESSGTRYDGSGTNSNNLSDINTVTSYSTTNQSVKEGVASASFARANSETLSITDASQTGLDITGNISMAAWFRLATTSETQDIVAKDGSDGNQGYQVRYNNNGQLNFGLSSDGVTANITWLNGATDLSSAAGEWHHVVAVYNGSTMQLYLDGASDATPCPTVAEYTAARPRLPSDAATATPNFSTAKSMKWRSLAGPLPLMRSHPSMKKASTA